MPDIKGAPLTLNNSYIEKYKVKPGDNNLGNLLLIRLQNECVNKHLRVPRIRTNELLNMIADWKSINPKHKDGHITSDKTYNFFKDIYTDDLPAALERLSAPARNPLAVTPSEPPTVPQDLGAQTARPDTKKLATPNWENLEDYTVKKGDTVEKIFKKFQIEITEENYLEWEKQNHTKRNKIKANHQYQFPKENKNQTNPTPSAVAPQPSVSSPASEPQQPSAEAPKAPPVQAAPISGGTGWVLPPRGYSLSFATPSAPAPEAAKQSVGASWNT